MVYLEGLAVAAVLRPDATARPLFGPVIGAGYQRFRSCSLNNISGASRRSRG